MCRERTSATVTSPGRGSTRNGRVLGGDVPRPGTQGSGARTAVPRDPSERRRGTSAQKPPPGRRPASMDRQPGPAKPPLFRRSGGQEDPVGNGSEEPRGHKLAFARNKHGDPRPGAVADEVLDEVFGPGQRAGPKRRHPGSPAAQREDERGCAGRVRGAQPPGHFFREPLQHPHGPAEFVQPHDCPDPGSRDRVAERTGGIQKIEMRFVLAAEELIDDESPGRRRHRRCCPRSVPDDRVRAGSQPNSATRCSSGRSNSPSRIRLRLPSAGNGSMPGEGLCDGTAWWAAAGCLPQGGVPFPSAGPLPGQMCGAVLPAEPGDEPAGGRLRNSIASITVRAAGHLLERAK